MRRERMVRRRARSIGSLFLGELKEISELMG